MQTLTLEDTRRLPAPGSSPDETAMHTDMAAFGQILQSNQYLNSFGYAKVLALVENALGTDPHGYRAEFLKLVRNAQAIDGSR